ncbi:hypothetical protein LBW94_035465 [Nocardia sp. alder85J]|nr:hypothetical protein [Nocardia sp. alder85J]MCX4097659.1 hypothetical protein [Nocardia sp. alder85J]
MGEIERQVGQGVEERDVGAAGSVGFGVVGGVELGDDGQRGGLLGIEVVVGAAQALGEGVVGVAVLGLPQYRVLPPGDVRDQSLQPLSFGLAVSHGAVVETVEVGCEEIMAVRAEYPVGEESSDRVQDGVFAEVDGFGVSGVLVRAAPVVVAGVAGVVAVVVAVVAEHPASAPAEHHAAQQIGAAGRGVGAGGVAVTGTAPGRAPGGEFVVHPFRDQRLVGGLGRPHPFHGIVDLPVPRPRRAPVEHLIPGVFGVLQYLEHARLAPGAAGAFAPGWHRRGILHRVGVEAVGDGVVAETFVVAPQRDLGDGFPAYPVGFQPGLGLSLRCLGRVGMPVGLRLVPVGRFADVPALTDVGAQSAPGLFESVEDFVFGHGLVDPPLQDPLGAAAGQRDRLVRGEQRYLGGFELSFDRQALEGAPGDAGDGLADHHVEAAAGVGGLVAEISDTAVAGDRDGEAVVVAAVATVVEFHAAGLDVVEVRHDHPRVGDRGLTVVQLPQHRLTRVLLILGGGAAQKRHPDLVTQHRDRNTQRGHRVVGQPRRPRHGHGRRQGCGPVSQCGGGRVHGRIVGGHAAAPSCLALSDCCCTAHSNNC